MANWKRQAARAIGREPMRDDLLSSPESASRGMPKGTGAEFESARDALRSADWSAAESAAARHPELAWSRYVLAVCAWHRGQPMRAAAHAGDSPLFKLIERQIPMLAARRQPTLSACLIVRNEANNLAACLQSIAGLATELIVIDTGSTDDTLSIAKKHGAVTAITEWRDDFALVRNAALERATGQWVLSIDADERLTAQSIPWIKAAMQDPSCAYSPLLKTEKGAQRYLSVRLFPREGARWEGALHEHVLLPNEIMPLPLPTFQLTTISSADEQSKRDRNRRIIAKMRDQGPEEARLADAYDALEAAQSAPGAPETIAKLTHALESMDDDTPFLTRKLLMTLWTQLLGNGQIDAAEQAVIVAEEGGYGGLWTEYFRARSAFLADDRKLACQHARKGLALPDHEGPVQAMRAELVRILKACE